MCHENFKIFRISNRGTNVFQQVANQRYSVNVPAELRDPTKTMKIEIIDGTIEMMTNTEFRSYVELGVSCNFTSGFDTENSGGFNSKNMEILFNVDLYEYKLANVRHPFKIHSECSFLLDQLPEKLVFSRYVVTDDLAVPLEFNGYISFILKITYYDKN
jgi:hypothetical protein